LNGPLWLMPSIHQCRNSRSHDFQYAQLCQVSEFVEVELAEPKIGDLVYKPAILGAYSKVIRDIEIGAAAIDESTSGLPVRTSHDELVSGIENECFAASQHVRSDASNVNGDVRDQGAGYFVKIRPKR
jgi:hypothetical protein